MHNLLSRIVIVNISLYSESTGSCYLVYSNRWGINWVIPATWRGIYINAISAAAVPSKRLIVRVLVYTVIHPHVMLHTILASCRGFRYTVIMRVLIYVILHIYVMLDATLVLYLFWLLLWYHVMIYLTKCTPMVSPNNLCFSLRQYTCTL